MPGPTNEERAEYYKWSRYKLAGAVVLLFFGFLLYGGSPTAGGVVMFVAVGVGLYYLRRTIHTARKMGQ